MKLTGKCKQDFVQWFIYNPYNPISLEFNYNEFIKLPFSMQYGVYVDFFDEHGTYCEIICMAEGWQSELWLRESHRVQMDWSEHLDKSTRNEARQKAIEKANEIYNQLKPKK